MVSSLKSEKKQSKKVVFNMHKPQNNHYRAEIYHDVGAESKQLIFYANKSTEGLESVYSFVQNKEKELDITRVEVYFVSGEDEEFVDLL